MEKLSKFIIIVLMIVFTNGCQEWEGDKSTKICKDGLYMWAGGKYQSAISYVRTANDKLVICDKK